MPSSNTKLSLYLTEAERAAVKLKAQQNYCSEAYVIRRLIHDYLEVQPPIISEVVEGSMVEGSIR